MAAKSAADIVADMVAALAVTDPEIDTSIGSFTRKVFDVVGEQVAPAYAIAAIDTWIYNIDTKTGADLDDFCALFGIYRVAAKRATGTVKFTRPSPAPANIPIPVNTIVSTGTTPQIVFVTASSVWMLKGTAEVYAPIQAVNAGVAGNLPVGSITQLGTNISGVSSTVTQTDATSGGVDAESDASLRTRFRNTIFRSMAGTEDMFLGISLEDAIVGGVTQQGATAATVLGATKRWREQVQVASGIAPSTIPVSGYKMVYEGTSIFGPDIDSGQIFTEDVHYTFDAGATPPEVHGISTNLTDGGVYDLDFEYVSSASRNNPAAGITNRVDVWIAGDDPESGSETTYYQPQTFVDTPTTSPYFVGNYQRMSDSGEDPPVAGNKFVQLAWGPILDFPEEIFIGGTTYVRDTDFWVVHDVSAFGLGANSKFGLEFASTSLPAANSQIVLSGRTAYVFNRLVRDIQQRAEDWRLVTTDVLVHAAKKVRLRLNIGIMYSPSYERGVVQAAVDSALAQWMDSMGFRSVVQVSDILQQIHNVDGVDNVKFLASNEPALGTDADSWGIEKVTADGTNLTNYGYGSGTLRAKDVVLADNEVPVLYDIRYVTKAQNTWVGA